MTDFKFDSPEKNTNLVNEISHKVKSPKKSNTQISRNIILIIIIGSVPILIGLLIFLYKNIYLSNTRIITSMSKNMIKLHSLDYKAFVDINFEGDFYKTSPLLPNKYSIKSNFSGAINRTDDNDFKISSDVSLVSQNLFSVNFDSRYVNKNLYISVKNIPDFGLPYTDEFINQWIRIDTSKFSNHLNSSDFKKYIRKFPLTLKPLENITNLKDETINGIDTFHYGYKINKDDLFKIFVEFTKNNGITLDEGDTKTLNKIKDRISFKDGLIWIDKKNLFLRKIDISAELLGDENTNQKIFIDIQMTFDNFNKPVIIQEPLESKAIDNFILPLLRQNNYLQ